MKIWFAMSPCNSYRRKAVQGNSGLGIRGRNDLLKVEEEEFRELVKFSVGNQNVSVLETRKYVDF